MKRIYLILIALLAVSMTAWSQAKLSFNEKVHDFGTIPRNRPVTVEYVVTNTGNKPLVITDVTVSCACTVAGWTKEPIMPDKTGIVRATFDAKMMGRFHKSVGVYTNALPNLVYLTMKGEVALNPKNYAQTHPYQIGSIRVDKTNIEFPDANKGDKPVVDIYIVNTSNSVYEPVLMHLPPYLKAQAIPAKLNKDQQGVIKLTLDSKKLKDLGLTQTSVYLARFPGDKVGEDNEINVSAVLLPDFSKLTEAERANAPIIKVSESEINMGSLGKDDKASHTVIVTNTGKSRLEIRELQVFNPAVNVSLKKKYINPGASTKLKVTLHGKGLKKMKHSPRVLMITNDPAQPKVMIKLKATAK